MRTKCPLLLAWIFDESRTTDWVSDERYLSRRPGITSGSSTVDE